jgi:hypothetical protein
VSKISNSLNDFNSHYNNKPESCLKKVSCFFSSRVVVPISCMKEASLSFCAIFYWAGRGFSQIKAELYRHQWTRAKTTILETTFLIVVCLAGAVFNLFLGIISIVFPKIAKQAPSTGL